MKLLEVKNGLLSAFRPSPHLAVEWKLLGIIVGDTWNSAKNGIRDLWELLLHL